MPSPDMDAVSQVVDRDLDRTNSAADTDDGVDAGQEVSFH